MRILAIIMLIFSLVGCSSKEEMRMIINNQEYPYNADLIKLIDKTKGMDKNNPPTVKTIKPDSKPDYEITVESNGVIENYILWERPDAYLIDITKPDATLWTAIDQNREYEEVKDKLTEIMEK